MYGRKLKGDHIDITQDFIGSVANRSKLSVCTIPSLNEQGIRNKKFENSNTKNRRVSSQNFVEMKNKGNNSFNNPSTMNTHEFNEFEIPLPKVRKRTERIKSDPKNGLFSKIGKRISTIGSLIENFENKNVNKRSVSSPQLLFTKKEDNHPSDVLIEPKGQVVPEPFEEKKLDQNYDTLDNSDAESINESDNHCAYEGRVFASNNQLYLNFSNESSGSLVSKLLNTYSTLNSDSQFFNTVDQFEHLSISEKRAHGQTPRLGNDHVFELVPPASVRNSGSTYTDMSTYESTKKSNDVFSTIPSTYSSDASDYVSFSDDLNLEIDGTENQFKLTTMNYNKKLPPLLIKQINQFKLRDYSDIENNPTIVDLEFPPELPRHKYLANNRRQVTEESPNGEIFYDCDDAFSFSSSNKSIIKYSVAETPSSQGIRKRLPKKVQIPQDTKIFTRKCAKTYGGITQNLEETPEKSRVSSYQYLKNVGIEPFMLNGYQNDTQLKVVNSK